MRSIVIKPHHFMDIIKLYGGGIELFVPDEAMGHDFYKVANQLLDDPDTRLTLTVEGDDICQPCKKYRNQCMDTVNPIAGCTSKDDYNKILDTRILTLLQLTNESYTARELCQILYKEHSIIDRVWQEEADETTKKRHDLFVKGAVKYLQKK